MSNSREKIELEFESTDGFITNLRNRRFVEESCGRFIDTLKDIEFTDNHSENYNIISLLWECYVQVETYSRYDGRDNMFDEYWENLFESFAFVFVVKIVNIN